MILALVGWGIWSAIEVSIEAVLDITHAQVQVITSSPLLAAKNIEWLLTFPSEVILFNIPRII